MIGKVKVDYSLSSLNGCVSDIFVIFQHVSLFIVLVLGCFILILHVILSVRNLCKPHLYTVTPFYSFTNVIMDGIGFVSH